MVDNWFKSSLGYTIIAQEQARCKDLIPVAYYGRSLQIGIPWINYSEGLEVSSHSFVDPKMNNLHYAKNTIFNHLDNNKQTRFHYTQADGHALPFPKNSHDLVLLPHTLDFSQNPHELLRQVNQILVPEGCVVLIGFNKLSFYGAVKTFKTKTKKQTGSLWSGNFYRVGRVQDWLALLGIDLVGAAMTCYGPPIASEKWQENLSFLDFAGDRWWPGFGGVYIIVGRKRHMTLTPLRKLKPWHSLIPGIAQPASQHAAKMGLRLILKSSG